MKIILAIAGIFLGVGIVGIAYNNKLGQAWDTITGSAAIASTASKNSKPSGGAKKPAFNLPPIFETL